MFDHIALFGIDENEEDHNGFTNRAIKVENEEHVLLTPRFDDASLMSEAIQASEMFVVNDI